MKYDGSEIVILLRDGTLIIDATNETAKEVKNEDWVYMGDLKGIAEMFTDESPMGKITIRIWRFYDAPLKYRDLSENGGDEDWIAFVPDALKDEYIGWLEAGRSFGCCTVEEHDVDGGKILIGCHS